MRLSLAATIRDGAPTLSCTHWPAVRTPTACEVGNSPGRAAAVALVLGSMK